MNIGYLKPGVLKENIDVQMDALYKYECEKITTKLLNKSKEISLLEKLHIGDTLVVYKIEYLEISLIKFIEFIACLQERNINFVSIIDNIDTRIEKGKLFFEHLSILSKVNKSYLSLKIRESLRNKGVKFGRKSKMTRGKINLAKKMFKSGVHYKEIANRLDVSVATIYRCLKS